jgi:hypothetical protein
MKGFELTYEEISSGIIVDVRWFRHLSPLRPPPSPPLQLHCKDSLGIGYDPERSSADMVYVNCGNRMSWHGMGQMYYDAFKVGTELRLDVIRDPANRKFLIRATDVRVLRRARCATVCANIAARGKGVMVKDLFKVVALCLWSTRYDEAWDAHQCDTIKRVVLF